MTFYNMMFGRNNELEVIVSTILGFRIDKKFPRYRDVFRGFEEDCPFREADVFIYTRTGGGNRECQCDKESDDKCYGCEAKELEEEPYVLGSWDDDFDSTYRTFAIRFNPEQLEEWYKVLEDDVSEEFKERAKKLYGNPEDKK